MSHLRFRHGRKPRGHSTLVPKFEHMMAAAGRLTMPPTPSVDYYGGQTEWGMLCNGDDPANPTAPVLGCCTCSGAFHGRQVWTKNILGAAATEPLSCVEQMYREACGWDGTPATDQGGCEQDVLRYWMQTGIPLGDGTRDKILAIVEVDPRNSDHMKHVLEGCGGLYTGQDMLACFEAGDALDWSLKRGSPKSGGHCTFGAKYTPMAFVPISWGMNPIYPWDSVAATMDEAYGIITHEWVKQTGLTPGGLSLDQLEAAMVPYRA